MKANPERIAEKEREKERIAMVSGDTNDKNEADHIRKQPMGISYPMMGEICAHFINGIGMLSEKARTGFD